MCDWCYTILMCVYMYMYNKGKHSSASTTSRFCRASLMCACILLTIENAVCLHWCHDSRESWLAGRFRDPMYLSRTPLWCTAVKAQMNLRFFSRGFGDMLPRRKLIPRSSYGVLCGCFLKQFQSNILPEVHNICMI